MLTSSQFKHFSWLGRIKGEATQTAIERQAFILKTTAPEKLASGTIYTASESKPRPDALAGPQGKRLNTHCWTASDTMRSGGSFYR